MSPIYTGLDRLLSDPDQYLRGRNIGLVVNHTSVAGDGRHAIEHFLTLERFTLKKLFAPEHGLYGVDQDMIPVDDTVDPLSGLPVLSLYKAGAESLSPDPAALSGLDHLIFDIQDIGARYYTFIYTLANCMKTCREAGVPIVVCDRPNPINGMSVEGNLVGKNLRSFVGQYPIPNRHGMTVGELAKLFNDHFGIGCDLTVVPLTGWERDMWYDETCLPWIPPSPNMPSVETATVYPGLCLVEGTLLSEGRGTTLPFLQVGAPYIDAHKLAGCLNDEELPGVFFLPQYFKPLYQKWAQSTCGGVHIHLTDRNQFKPLLTGVAVLRAVARLYPGDFAWRTEPYEFVADRPAIDLLYGNTDLRERFLPEGESLQVIEDSWQQEQQTFEELRAAYLLY